MQLNPARGRKHGNETRTNGDGYVQVYAAQPREGTETLIKTLYPQSQDLQVYAAQPREGTETCNSTREHVTL